MRKRKSDWWLLFIAIGLFIVIIGALISKEWINASPDVAFSGSDTSNLFVTRSGSRLLLNGHPFRFAGANMHWLALNDSTEYPSHFEVDDALAAAKDMGITVVRSHNIGISTGCANCLEPILGVFNQTALEHDDYVIKTAREDGIRLIIPLTDNWHYAAGGKHDFTDWHSIKDENEFYFNQEVINDFEKYIRVLLTHVNVYTGVMYKDDPTILAWETGNELKPPTSWTQTISTYIKTSDSNHLVMDGRSGIDPDAAHLTNVDIVSKHYYPKQISALERDATTARNDGKAFVVGEFDWNDANGGDPLSSFLSAIESNPTIAGDAFWELWSHDDEYGYVTGQREFMFHYPGDSEAMRSSAQLLRAHAYHMREIPTPPEEPPARPMIKGVIRDGSSNVVVWRGATGAASYTVERSTISDKGPWTTICDKCATDMNVPWLDKDVPSSTLWYYVIPYNVSGVAGPTSNIYRIDESNIVVDNLDDWSKVYNHSANLTFDTSNPLSMNNDHSRAIRTTATPEFIIWKQFHMTSFQATAYFWPKEPISPFSIYTSPDGNQWTLTEPAVCYLHGTWLEYVYTLSSLDGVNYVKVMWNNTNGQVWNPSLGSVSITSE